MMEPVMAQLQRMQPVYRRLIFLVRLMFLEQSVIPSRSVMCVRQTESQCCHCDWSGKLKSIWVPILWDENVLSASSAPLFRFKGCFVWAKSGPVISREGIAWISVTATCGWCIGRFEQSSSSNAVQVSLFLVGNKQVCCRTLVFETYSAWEGNFFIGLKECYLSR